MKKQKITAESISSMSYPDFVGFINQWNVLPGAHVTLSKWRVFSQMSSKSKILEVACTTGFSSRELAIMTNCEGTGFDISKLAITSANYNKKYYAPQIKIKYVQKDGYRLKTNEKFSHVVIGASLKFFPKPQEMLNKCISWLEDGGYILASPFYITSPIPDSLLREFQSVFGFKPTIESYKDISNMYKGLEIIYEEHKDIIQETKEELEHYCNSTINRACKLLKIKDEKIKNVMYQRLYAVKEMSNKLRPYQKYLVLVLKYNKKVFPNRYVELF